MAFIISGGSVLSFASFSDVLATDQRLFEANEGLTEDGVEQSLVRATERILSLFRNSDWWVDLYITKSPNVSLQTRADVPPLDPLRIQDRQDDFTDLCVYYALYNYILPSIADFSREDNAERAKIGFYQGKFNGLFGELISRGDWYNFDGAGAITSDDKMPGVWNLRRIR